ncbi:MAG: DUF892 family protein [Ferruginibacter sp.]
MTSKKSSVTIPLEEDQSNKTDSSALLDFVAHELKDLYSAEKSLAKAIPKILKTTVNNAVKEMIANHLDISQLHSEKLERVFGILGTDTKSKASGTMEALLQEINTNIEKSTKTSWIRESVLVMAFHKIKHHKIATYSVLVELIGMLRKDNIMELLEEMLNDEKKSAKLIKVFDESNYPYLPVNANQQVKPAAVYESINLEGKKTLKQ